MQLVVIKVSNRQIAPQLVEGKLVVISPELHRRSDKSRHFGVDIAAAGREAPLPLPKPKLAELEVGKEGGKGKVELGDTGGKGKVGLAGWRSRRRQDHFIAAAQTEDRGARGQDAGQQGQGCARDPEARRQGQGQFCQCRRERSRPADTIAFAKHEDRRVGRRETG